MLCQICGLNEANRLYQSTSASGETHSAYLCAACAGGAGSAGSSSGAGAAGNIGGASGFDAEFAKAPFDFDLPAMMSEMLGLRTHRPGGVCPACGLRLEELSKYGRTGCVACYRHFAPALAPYVRRIHGDASHTGRAPAGAAPELARQRRLEELRHELQECIKSQAFERAAVLRDEIAKLQEGGAKP
ncbi:MAG: UvrB/UvrC motif-containing protein [Oscillospiraceae bacterium]|nr:UvrB/UvrC motif-containing protein [Oscillospiraceae bacterium]